MTTEYLLDTNVLITAIKYYYPLDFCPGFWDFIIEKSQTSEVFVTQSVIDEIKNGASPGDPLQVWIDNNISSLKIIDDTTQQIQQSLGQILSDIDAQELPNNFARENIDNFANIADAWIIASALTKGATIVTNETLAGANSTKIKIPNICNHYNIPYVTPFQMLRQLGINLRHN